eukprot:1996798-Pleurochrysis_carterae.AAC.1
MIHKATPRRRRAKVTTRTARAALCVAFVCCHLRGCACDLPCVRVLVVSVGSEDHRDLCQRACRNQLCARFRDLALDRRE